MTLKEARDYLQSLMHQKEFQSTDIDKLDDLFKELKKGLEEENATVVARQEYWENVVCSPDAVAEKLNDKYNAYRKLTIGKRKIDTGNEALDHKLKQIRFIRYFHLILFLAIMISIPISPLFIALCSGVIAIGLWDIKLKRDIGNIVSEEVKQYLNNCGAAYNFYISLKKVRIYHSLIRFTITMRAVAETYMREGHQLETDNKMLLDHLEELDSYMATDIEELKKPKKQKVDIQTLKKSFPL